MVTFEMDLKIGLQKKNIFVCKHDKGIEVRKNQVCLCMGEQLAYRGYFELLVQ